MNENGQHIFEIFRQGEEEVFIASLARWNAQLKGLVELERRCRKTMQEVQVLSDRQEIFTSCHVGRHKGRVQKQTDGVTKLPW